MVYSWTVGYDIKGLTPSKASGMMSFRKPHCCCLDVSLFACQPPLMWAHPFHPPLTAARSFHQGASSSPFTITLSHSWHTFFGDLQCLSEGICGLSVSMDMSNVTGMSIAHLAQGEREKLLIQTLNTSQNHASKDELEKTCSSTVKVFPVSCFGCSHLPKSSSSQWLNKFKEETLNKDNQEQKEAQTILELLQAGKVYGRSIIKCLPCFDTALHASGFGLCLREVLAHKGPFGWAQKGCMGTTVYHHLPVFL